MYIHLNVHSVIYMHSVWIAFPVYTVYIIYDVYTCNIRPLFVLYNALNVYLSSQRQHIQPDVNHRVRQ